MQTLLQIFWSWGALAALILFISVWQYIWGIYKRDVPRPLISSWSLWSILGLLLLIAYYKSGARLETTLLAAWIGFVNPILVTIIILLMRYGELTWTKLDTICSVIFIVTVIAWYTLDNPVIGLAGGIVADLVSAIPQIRKNWQEPHDEVWQPWAVFAIGSGINLFAVEQWGWSWEATGHWLYPMYFTLGGSLIAVPVILHRFGYYK